MATLAQILLDAPDLKERLAQHLIEQRSEKLQDETDVAQLEAERDELKQRINTMLRVLSGPALADAEPELKRLSDRRNAVEAHLNAVARDQASDLRPVDAIVADAVRMLAEESQTLLTLPIEPLRILIDRLIADAAVNMETKAVEFQLNLPTWALQIQPKPNAKQEKRHNTAFSGAQSVCPPDSLRSSTSYWTHRPWVTVRCDYQAIRGSNTRPVCYECRRHPQAA